MQTPDIQIILPYVGSAAAAFLGAWIATFFALRRFYREKLWERKAAAYTAIFEALHGMQQWYDKHWDAYIEQRDLDDAKSEALLKTYHVAEAELSRRLASETWLIPDRCRVLLEKLTSDLARRREDWFSHLDEGLGALINTTKELRKLVHADLNVTPWWRRQVLAVYLSLKKRLLPPPPPPWAKKA